MFKIPPDLPPEITNIFELARCLFPAIIAKQLTGQKMTSLEAEYHAAVGEKNQEQLKKIASRYAGGER